jgi:anti-sigma regulatory factor (Ser/Thr protein kinase)/biotin operon repressor
MNNRINQIIFKKLDSSGEFTIKEIQDEANVSRQAIHKHVKELLKEGKIVKIGITRGVKYVMANKVLESFDFFNHSYINSALQEDKVLDSVKFSLMLKKQINLNANEIFTYAFTEILNNAIEHSNSERIAVEVKLLSHDITFQIRDYGIGIFTNIKNKYNLDSMDASIQELLKGKTTTMPDHHSGEGLFFTSRVSDLMEISSQKFIVGFNNNDDEIFTGSIRALKGTNVFFSISRNTKKKLKDTFDAFAGQDYDFTFSKTSVKVKLFEVEKNRFVSRSIAKRLLFRLDQFEEIVIDFSGVNMIGQGFADEIFRVFKNQHPKIKLKPVNASEGITAMILHVSPNNKG